MSAFTRTPGEPLEIEVSVVMAPDGLRVMLALPDGFVLISAASARTVGAMLLNAADHLDAELG